MLNFLKKHWLIIVIDLLIVAFCCGVNFYSLTYTQVPLQSAHLWYGKDLHTYLLVNHLITTIIMIVGEVFANIFYFGTKRK